MRYCTPSPYQVKVISCLYKPWTSNYKPKAYNQIITIVCEITGITEMQIKSKSRIREFADARHIAIAFIRLYHPKMTYKSIGKLFGGRHHSTILNSKNVTDKLIQTDLRFTEKYSRVNDTISKVIRRKGV